MTDQQLNEQVARKLGHRLLEYPDSGEWKIRQDDGPKMFYLVNIPDYCHSIQAAWEIVERENFIISRYKNRWMVSDQGETDELAVNVFIADTAPRAIALCFLKLP